MQPSLNPIKYDGSAETWGRAYRSPDPYGRRVQRRRDVIVDAVERRLAGRRARILDAGCGTGELARRLAATGHSVVALELSSDMLAEARRDRGGSRPSPAFVRASVGTLPFPPASFDAIVFSGILGHLLRRRTPRRTLDAEKLVLQGLLRVLRPAGFIVMDGPNLLRLHWLLDPPRLWGALKVRREFNRLERQLLEEEAVSDPATLWTTAPIRHSTPGELRRTLRAVGLRIVEWNSVGYGPFSFLRRPIVSAARSVRLSEAIEQAARRTPLRLLDRLASNLILTVVPNAPAGNLPIEGWASPGSGTDH